MKQEPKKLVGRHGDLWIYKLEKMPKKTEKTKHVVLAEGEATGHCHVLGAKFNNSLIEHGKNENGDLCFLVPKTMILTHTDEQGHNSLYFEKGMYVVIKEREHDYYKNEVRTVLD